MRLDHTPNEEIVEGTLEWCNQIRMIQGKPTLAELPKGKVGDPASCPCGEATGLLVGTSTYRNEQDQVIGVLPDAVETFVHRFDIRDFGLRKFIAEDDQQEPQNG